MEIEHDKVKSTRRVKVSSKITHKRLLDRITKLSRCGIERFYYHYLVPGLNMSLQNTKLEDLAIIPNIQCEAARPLYVASNVYDKIDLCHRRVAISYGFNYKIRYNASVFEKYLKKKEFRKAMKNGTFPAAVMRTINLRKANPYPFFNGEYDWYFSGGNLVYSNGYLLRATGSNMDILNISSIKKQSLKDILNIEYNNQEENAPTSEILEIQNSCLKDQFVTRCEKNITKYSYEDCVVNCLYNIRKNSVPFITFCEDPFNDNIIITGDLNRHVFIWDINYSVTDPFSKLISQNEEILERSDNWNIIRHFNKSYFAFADFEKFALIDSRIQHTAEKIKFSTFEENIGICENISSLIVSEKYANIIYIGTTHKIFAIDARYLKKNSKNILLLKWIHQMKYPPLILKTHNASDFELIAASSPLNGEIRLFEVKKTHTENMTTKYISSFLPISPPNLIESFYFTKLQGECLNPLINLESRIKKCTTGITFFEKNNKLQLIIGNSIGDILSCKITINEENECPKKYNSGIIKNYYNAVKEKSGGNSRELFVTDLKNMKNMNKILRCAKLSSKEEFQQQYNNNSNHSENYANNGNDYLIDDFLLKKRKLWKWEKSPSQYAQCKDVLASNLLQIWEFDIDEAGNEKLFEKKAYSTSDKEINQNRVIDWVDDIQKNYYKNNVFSGEIIEDIILTREINNFSDEFSKLTDNNISNIQKTNFKISSCNETKLNTINKKYHTNSNHKNKLITKEIAKRDDIETSGDTNSSNSSNSYRNNLKTLRPNKTKLNAVNKKYDTNCNQINESISKANKQQSLIGIETSNDINILNDTLMEKKTENTGTKLFKKTQSDLVNHTEENKKSAVKRKRQYIKGF